MPIRYTADELRKMIEQAGWVLIRSKGSHLQFKHPERPGTVTIPAHKGTMPMGTANSILKQAGLK